MPEQLRPGLPAMLGKQTKKGCHKGTLFKKKYLN